MELYRSEKRSRYKLQHRVVHHWPGKGRKKEGSAASGQNVVKEGKTQKNVYPMPSSFVQQLDRMGGV